LNTQRSGLMKSMLSLLKRLCLDAEWSDVMQAAMDGEFPNILRRIFLNGPTHFTPHLALFAMEAITNYLYTYPSRISAMQDKQITTDILKAMTDQPLPQNRDFLVQLPGLFNTLALNSRGIEAIQSSGVLSQYLDTLVSPEYLPTMKTKRVRDFLSQISYNPTSGSGQSLSNSLTASQMSNAIQELLRSHNELKPTVFQSLVACIKRVVELGNMQPATLLPEPVSSSDVPDFSTQGDQKSSTHLLRPLETHNQPSGSGGSSHTVAAGCAARTTTHIGEVPNSTQDRGGVMLDDDVVMLSGGEDEDEDDENDIDDVTRATQTASTAATRQSGQNTGSRLLDSRSVSPTTSLNLKEGATPTGNKIQTILPDGTPIPPQMFLSDFMLNTCKFLEKLLPSALHVTEAMCRHFVSHGGLQVLCDLLQMPGLPYDFPVSAACASLCKIFEDLANSINLNDVIEPLFQCLESSLTKLSDLYNSHFRVKSILLIEYMAQEHTHLHELVVTASIICIMVQIIDHLKPELRPTLANKWISRSLLTTLGRLYLGVSWEAGILLTVLAGDKEITEEDLCPSKKSAMHSTCSRPGSSKPTDGDVKTALNAEPIPQFVEALHIYALLKPKKTHATHRIVHVTAFLINSVTELFTAWGRFFANRNQVSYRRRRMNLTSNEQIPSFTKYVALSQVSQVLTGILSWEVPTVVANHRASPRLLCAMRYAAVRMTNLLLHDPNHKGPQGGMLHAFFFQGGVQRYFGLFRELINLDLNNPDIREPLTEVLEEWLVCAGRISNTDHVSAELRRISDTDGSTVDVEKYVESIHQSMLFPLEQLCIRSDLQLT
uniref:DUF913 domain-containing protein n=1 Tax=Echinostoma caproni TaxID=27848 RepID=A0A183B235_9TREM